PEPLPARPAPMTRTAPKPQAAAAELFRKTCQNCHGADGKGDSLRDEIPGIPDFTSRAWQEKRSKAHIAANIMEGKGSRMPGFRSKLTPAQANDLVTFIRAFGPAQAEAVADS